MLWLLKEIITTSFEWAWIIFRFLLGMWILAHCGSAEAALLEVTSVTGPLCTKTAQGIKSPVWTYQTAEHITEVSLLKVDTTYSLVVVYIKYPPLTREDKIKFIYLGKKPAEIFVHSHLELTNTHYKKRPDGIILRGDSVQLPEKYLEWLVTAERMTLIHEQVDHLIDPSQIKQMRQFINKCK